MGRQQLYLDAAALRSAVECFDSTAAAIDNSVRIQLGGLVFDGRTAGRDHVAAGESLRRALQAWSPELMRWSRAGTEIATALRAGLARYERAEVTATERVG